LHLADHPAAAAIDAIPVAVEATVVAAVLSFEALAPIVPLGPVVALEPFRPFESLGPLGAVLRTLGRTLRPSVGPSIISFNAFMAAIVSPVHALESLRTVVANDSLVALGALQPFDAIGPLDALCAIWPIYTLGAIGPIYARRPFGSIESFGALGQRASLGRFRPLRPFAAVIECFILDATCIDLLGGVIGIGRSRSASATAGSTDAARRLRG
jgi:hypothetical protein